MCLCCVWTDEAGCSPVFWNLLGIHSTRFDFLGHWGNGIWALLQRGQQYLCWAVWARFPAAIEEGDPFSSAEIWWFLPVEELAWRLSHEFERFSWFGAFMVYLARNQKKYLLFFPYILQQIMLVFSKNQWTTKSPLEACCWNTRRCYKYIKRDFCLHACPFIFNPFNFRYSMTLYNLLFAESDPSACIGDLALLILKGMDAIHIFSTSVSCFWLGDCFLALFLFLFPLLSL